MTDDDRLPGWRRKRLGRWTPERIAYLMDHYVSATPIPDIVAAINAMPGEPVNDPQVRGYAASVLHLSRPRTKAERADPGFKDAARPDERDVLEAKMMLRKGATVSAVAAEFGQPVSLIERWHEEMIAERSGPLTRAGSSARTEATP
jgi:hypothetical protein